MFNAKKIATSIAAAALMMGVSTSAFAAFADMQLIRVVYERETGTTESLTDLGNLDTLLSAGSTTIAGSALSANNASNLYVAYFAIKHSTTTPEFWVAGKTTTTPIAVGRAGFNTTQANTTKVFSQYNAIAGGSAVTGTVYTGQQSAANSYKSQLSASQGSFFNAINIATRSSIEANLSALLLGTATSVTQNLYYFANANTSNSVGVNIKQAQIITNADGSTTVTTTPIPAAIYLMGSGLLGLVGIRRRKNA